MKLYKLKLNMQGIQHIILPLVTIVILVGAAGTYFIISSHAATLSCRERTIKNGTLFGPGSSGECVVDIQKAVRDFGTHGLPSSYFKSWTGVGKTSLSQIKSSNFLDGDYGTVTEGQVEDFQAWFSNSGGPDGVVGKQTWTPLCSAANIYFSNSTYDEMCASN